MKKCPKRKLESFSNSTTLLQGSSSKTQNLYVYTLNFEQKLDLNYFCPKECNFYKIQDLNANIYDMS
jgi:hypothetical protein